MTAILVPFMVKLNNLDITIAHQECGMLWHLFTALLSVFEGVPHIKVEKSDLENVGNFIDLLSTETNSEIFTSKGEAKRMIKGGGISINKEKIADGEAQPELNFLQEKFLLIQKGKKNYFIVEAV